MAIGLGQIIYAKRSGKVLSSRISKSHCVEPWPGSLVMFTVPRFHRVYRVGRVAGEGRQLSIAGWFMTEHRKVR